MKIILPESIDKAAWLRYMQVSAEPEPDFALQMAKAEKLLLETASARSIYRVVDRPRIPVEGISIRRHLEGCDRAAVLAVTIGAGVDALIRRFEITDLAMAMILDTGASVLAEQAADATEEAVSRELGEKMPGLFLTPRFSPGYGDWPLRCQRQILSLVDAGRKTGITLTAGDMMVPHKSITGVIGLSDHPVKGRLAGCDECLLRDKCSLRLSGKHC